MVRLLLCQSGDFKMVTRQLLFFGVEEGPENTLLEAIAG